MFDKAFTHPSLVEALVRGENDAYEQLVDALEPELCAFFRFRQVQPTLEEDLAATTIAQLYSFFAHRYNAKRGRPGAIVTMIAKNVLADYWRNPNNTRLTQLSDCPEPSCDPEITFAAESEESASEESNEEKLMRLGMDSLNKRDRSILEHRRRGATIYDLAQVFKICPNTAKLRLRRAIQKLKRAVEKLQDEGDTDDTNGPRGSSRRARVPSGEARLALSSTKKAGKYFAQPSAPDSGSRRKRRPNPRSMDSGSSK